MTHAGSLLLTVTIGASALSGCACDVPLTGDRDAAVRDAARTDDDAASNDDAAAPDAFTLDDAGPVACALPHACDAPYPDLGETDDWNDGIRTPITVALGSPRHRGRDLYLRASDAQWALAKFAYGVSDDDIQGEDVDLYLDRDCSGAWEPLGMGRITDDDEHAAVEGVDDTGGRVYFEIPAAVRLGLGRHRILFAVRGDHSTAEQLIDVVPDDARFVVTDVDGTQTESETAEWGSLLTGSGPAAQPHGAEALEAFARRGYRILYLTARPEWLEPRTHAWLDEMGYPPGLVHTTLGLTGATGAPAATFKTDELTALTARFPSGLAYGIGNTETDAAAYASTGLPAERIVSYRFDGEGATRMDDYAELVTIAEALAPVCD